MRAIRTTKTTKKLTHAASYALQYALTAALLLTLLLSTTGCLPIEEEPLPPPILAAPEASGYKTIAAARGDVLLHRYCNVYLAPSREEDLSFSLNDLYIKRVYVQEGDTVSEGDIVAELDRSYFLDEIAKTERDEAWARLYLKQLDELHAFDIANKGISGSPVDEESYSEQRETLLVQLEILSLRKEYLQHEDDLRVLRSSMDGVVAYLAADLEGSLTVADRRIIAIADRSKQIFVLRGSDADLVNVGDMIELLASGVTYAARVVDPAEPGISRSAGTSEKYIVLLDDSVVISQDTASIHIIIDRSDDTIFIPKSVIRRANTRTFVYVLADNVRTIRDIETGLEGSTEVEILAGLQEGELVIVG